MKEYEYYMEYIGMKKQEMKQNSCKEELLKIKK